MFKAIVKFAPVIALALSVAAPASAGSLAKQGLADPVVVPCTTLMAGKAAPRTVKIVREGNGRCPIEFVQADIDWLYAQPAGTETYIGAYKNGKLCAIPAKWDARRASGNPNFQEPRVYPWRKKCGGNADALIRSIR